MRLPTSRLLPALAAALLVACGSGAAADADTSTASAADTTAADTTAAAPTDTPRADTARAAGMRTTRAGYAACTSRQSLQRLLRAVAAGDSARVRAFDAETPRSCFPLKGGTKVEVVWSDSLLTEIRTPGARLTMFTNREAVQ